LGEHQIGKDRVFLKYYHTEQLVAILRKHRSAYLVVERVCRGFIDRQRFVCEVGDRCTLLILYVYRFHRMLAAKEAQTARVADFFASAEVCRCRCVVSFGRGD
jgi:hypothetical protein